MLFNEQEIETTVRALASDYIAEKHPDESVYFSLIWKHLSTLHLDRDNFPAAIKPADLGLPFADDASIPLVTPFVMITLEQTLRELSLRGHAPDLNAVRDAVRRAADAFGAPRNLITELERHLSPRLHEAFQSAKLGLIDMSADTDTRAGGKRPADEQRPEQLFIKRYVNGVKRKPGWCLRDVRPENRKNASYDIVVDELARDVIIRSDRENPDAKEARIIAIEKLDPKASVMLWLVLKNFGKAVDYEQARTWLNLAPDGSQDNPIHQAKNALGKHLGSDLMAKLFEKPTKHRYPIRSDGINFCWMRLTEDPCRSELLYRAGHPSE